MPEERHDVHADPTQDHLSASADPAVVEAADAENKRLQEEHFNPDALLASSDSDVPTSEKRVGTDDGAVDSVEKPASLFPEDKKN